MTTNCRTCKEPIEHVGYRTNWDTGQRVRHPGSHIYTWFHVDDRSDDHMAEPAPACPKCGSANYVHDATDAWADYTRCGDCRYEHRMSLGD